jgi:hypothetical protein
MSEDGRLAVVQTLHSPRLHRGLPPTSCQMGVEVLFDRKPKAHISPSDLSATHWQRLQTPHSPPQPLSLLRWSSRMAASFAYRAAQGSVVLGALHGGLTLASFVSSFPSSARVTPVGEGTQPQVQSDTNQHTCAPLAGYISSGQRIPSGWSVYCLPRLFYQVSVTSSEGRVRTFYRPLHSLHSLQSAQERELGNAITKLWCAAYLRCVSASALGRTGCF